MHALSAPQSEGACCPSLASAEATRVPGVLCKRMKRRVAMQIIIIFFFPSSAKLAGAEA